MKASIAAPQAPSQPLRNRFWPGFIALVLLLLSGPRLMAGVLLMESFENYNQGFLDANMAGGPNAAPNGGPGNPWWAPFSPNLQVVGAELGVFPHSGTNMVRGRDVNVYDTDFFNLAFRCNGGSAFTGNILCDWWFYDPLGQDQSVNQFTDYLALGNYGGLPTTSDYSTANLNNVNQTPLAQPVLSLGGSDHLGGSFDPTLYQAQVFGTTNGYDPSDPLNNWLNTTTLRAVGWHHARILVSAVTTNNLVNVSFFVDDITTPTLTQTAPVGAGFNAIQLLTKNGGNAPVSGYFDDLLFSTAPLQIPNPQLAVSGTNTVVTFPAPWILQVSTNLSAGFVDVTNAVSPYTNSAAINPQFYRLRF